MTATTKRIIDTARREQIVREQQVKLYQAIIALERARPSAWVEPQWQDIHACRKALTAATVALDAIETQMPSEGRRGR
jgi:hypothetical protein